jgi:hypothetical protein
MIVVQIVSGTYNQLIDAGHECMYSSSEHATNLSASEPWLGLDLGLDAGLLRGVVKNIGGFVSNVVHFVLDPLGRARDLGPSVSYGLILNKSLVLISGTPLSQKWKGRK